MASLWVRLNETIVMNNIPSMMIRPFSDKNGFFILNSPHIKFWIILKDKTLGSFKQVDAKPILIITLRFDRMGRWLKIDSIVKL
jgi:hypothetical protein